MTTKLEMAQAIVKELHNGDHIHPANREVLRQVRRKKCELTDSYTLAVKAKEVRLAKDEGWEVHSIGASPYLVTVTKSGNTVVVLKFNVCDDTGRIELQAFDSRFGCDVIIRNNPNQINIWSDGSHVSVWVEAHCQVKFGKKW